jgi:Flp pilus assembly protein TadD
MASLARCPASRAWLLGLLFAAAIVAGAARAAGGGGGAGGGGSEAQGAQAASPELGQAVAAIRAERWSEAIVLLERHVKQARSDADAYNWLGYANRKSGRLDEAFTHYKRALTIDPTHRGAHEYIGEAYLMAGQPQQAEYHLRELARLCASNCEEFQDLGEAIGKYRMTHASAGNSP